MIEIIKDKPAPFPAKRIIIPSPMYPLWREILSHTENEMYSIVASDGGEIIEKVDFCILERSLGKFLVSIPYAAYGSCLSRAAQAHLKALFRELEGFAKDHGCLSLSICTHPLSELAPEEIKSYFDFEFKHENFTQFSELDEHPLNKLKSKRRAAFRNEISKVAGDDNIILVKEPDFEDFKRWRQIYLNRYQELGANPFPDWFFENMFQASAASDLLDFWILKRGEELLGGIFFTRGKNVVDYFSSAFDRNWDKHYPTTYVINEYLNRLVEEGVRYFNWHSSPSREGGVYHYKRRWGAYELLHYFLSKSLVSREKIRKIPLPDLKRECAGCYILPYAIWE